MLTVHDEAACADRDQLFQCRPDPVPGFHNVERDISCNLAAEGEAYEFADGALIWCFGEMQCDVPAPAGAFGRGDRGIALEKALAQEIDHALRGLFVADREGGTVAGGADCRGHDDRGFKAAGPLWAPQTGC